MRRLAAMFVVVTSAATAAEVGPCGDLDRISNLVGQTRSYAKGDIRIAHVDTGGEPVCCSSHLLVLIPSDEIGTQCFAVSQKAATADASARGFSNIDLSRIKASYDAKRGLLLTVPYTLYNLDDRRGTPGSTNVRVSVSRGNVTIEP
jgi:hypothetical protein